MFLDINKHEGIYKQKDVGKQSNKRVRNSEEDVVWNINSTYTLGRNSSYSSYNIILEYKPHQRSDSSHPQGCMAWVKIRGKPFKNNWFNCLLWSQKWEIIVIARLDQTKTLDFSILAQTRVLLVDMWERMNIKIWIRVMIIGLKLFSILIGEYRHCT